MFEGVSDIKIEMESSQGILEIADLFMEDPRPTPNGKMTDYAFRFDCQEGVFQLRATGFKMYVRQSPRLSKRNVLLLADRGGISFAQVSFA